MPAPWARGARVVIKGRMHGSETNNVLHFATNTTVNDGSQLDALLLALAVAVAACIIDELLPAITSDWTLESVSAQGIYPVLTDPVINTAPANTVGTSPGTNVSFAASLVNVRTGIGGRKGRGKIFLPPPGDSVITDSKLTQAPIDVITSFLQCVADKFHPINGTEEWVFGVLSRKDLTGIGGGFDAAFRAATQLSPQSIVAKMGSRKLGKGA
jgi:hypothetical protein